MKAPSPLLLWTGLGILGAGLVRYFSPSPVETIAVTKRSHGNSTPIIVRMADVMFMRHSKLRLGNAKDSHTMTEIVTTSERFVVIEPIEQIRGAVHNPCHFTQDGNLIEPNNVWVNANHIASVQHSGVRRGIDGPILAQITFRNGTRITVDQPMQTVLAAWESSR